MKIGVKNHLNKIKNKQPKQTQQNSIMKVEYDQISTFRNTLAIPMQKNSNYKTSKNSPDRFFIEKIKKNKISPPSINIELNRINQNSNLIYKTRSNEKNSDKLLKRKIIKLKEKKSITMGNTLINNSTNLTNTSINNNNNFTSSNLNNYVPHSNFNKKIKSKITLDTFPKNILFNNFQKRENSILEDEEKNSIIHSNRENYLVPKYLSSSTNKHKSIIKNFNTLQNKPNNLILQSHLKNNQIFNHLNSIYKLNNKSIKYKLNVQNKTTFQTQSNSRKNSVENNNVCNISNNNSNINIHLKNKINNFIESSPLSQRLEYKNFENIIKPYNQKSSIGINKIQISDSTKMKLNSISNSKEPSKNNSKENIFIKNKISEKKIVVLEKLDDKNINPKLKKLDKISFSEKNTSTKGKILVSTNSVKNNVINISEIKKNESEISEKNKNDYSEIIKIPSSIKVNKSNKSKPKINEKKEQKENSKILKNSDSNSKEKNEIPDRDIESEENLKDNLLNYLNSNVDNNNNNNINESMDSTQSTTKEKYILYSKDKDIISSYIKEYFNKNGIYPSTKMKFYKYGRLLGKGAFGKVNLSLHTLTGRLVAIKSINKSKIITERQKSKIQIETSIMKTLSSSHYIVKFFETYETQKHICIVMEYICAGDLLSYIRKRNKLNEQTAKYIYKQIILGIQHIHNHNIIHRDIKLDNILIDLDNKIKICDFGVSKRINNNDKIYEQCGTPTYIAPEILKGKGYVGYGVDVWSSGVVLYAMLSGTVPFKGNNLKDLHDAIMKGNYKVINDVSNEANHLLKSIFEVDPKKRISIQEILFHPWLIDVQVENNYSYNLFTNTERILLAKSNVDYRNPNNKDDMIENFNIRNLDTDLDNESKNVKTKSFILAPFNSSIEPDNNDESIIDNNNKELIIKNNVIKFSVKVKEINRIYELNNNGEIDNGVVISMDSNEKKIYNNLSPSPYNNMSPSPYNNMSPSPYNNMSPSPNNNNSFYNKGKSKPFSPNNEIEDNFIKKEYKEKKKVICEDALNELVKLGYLKPYVRECLHNNEKNYATASYYLLVKYCY